MRKWQVLIFFLMSAIPLRAQEEGISEYTVDDDGYVTGDYSAPVPEPLPVADPVLVEQTPVVHRARTSVTVSLFYPFYMGSGVDFVSDYAFNPDYGGTPVSTTLNGGVDIELRFVVADYLLLGGGFSWGGTFLFDSANEYLEEDNSSMKVLTLRALIGGIYPIASWVSFFGGVQGGFLQLIESGYLKAINAQYDEIALPCGMIAPFVGFDFILSGDFSISLKADFTAGFSSRNNLLNRNRIESVMYPGIYLGFGMVF